MVSGKRLAALVVVWGLDREMVTMRMAEAMPTTMATINKMAVALPDFMMLE